MSHLPLSESQSSENSSVASQADSFDSQTAKVGIKRFGALWPLMPPVALFGIAFAFIGAPLPTPIGNQVGIASTSVTSASDWVVPASETIVVVKQPASSYAVLRGRLRAPRGAVVTAPSRGQVARVMVRTGQVVKAGDPLLLISRGTIDAPRRTSPLERWQTQAESAQIAAARQQEALEVRMVGAHERLQNAQQRVAAAQKRVADARALIKRLQDGEEVNRGDVSGAAETTKSASAAPRPADNSSQNEKRAAQARADAVQKSQQLQKSADAAEAKAKAAASAAKKADSAVYEKQSQLTAATAALAAAKTPVRTAPEKAPDGDEGADGASASATPPPTPPDTREEARAVSAARDALASATSRAATLHREAAKQKAHAAELRSNANAAARRAMQSLQVFEGESATASRTAKAATPRETAKTGNDKTGSDKVTIADAARIARQAMKESDAAIADADRIRREVKTYERPVSGTKQRFDAATERLQNAQQQIWNSAGASRPIITRVGASSTGVVLSIAGMASNVSGGEVVASIGRPDRLEVVILDSSGAWKSLSPGARVLALVRNNVQNARTPNSSRPTSGNASASPAPEMDPAGKSTPALARSTSTTPTAPTDAEKGMPTLARVVAIAPPTKAGAPARVRVAVHNPPRNGRSNENGLSLRAFTPGMGVLLSVAKPGKRVMIRVPSASIRRDENGKTFVAVLSPVPDAMDNQPTSACRVEWRTVQVGAGDGINHQILAGLEPGDRVALRPDALYKFTLANGSHATVRVEQT